MWLDGTKLREPIKIRCDAASPEVRKLNKAAAEEVYHARMVQLARAKVGLPLATGERFAHWSAWFEEHHTAKHRGEKRERVILARLRKHFDTMLLSDIKPARWAEYETARRHDGVSINTIGRELAVMKAVLRAAVGEHLEVSPLVHVRRTTTRLPAKRTVTKADEIKLLEEIHDDEIRDLYLVGVGTLLRQANLINLQRREHHGTRLVLETKSGPHTVPLDGPTTLQRRAAAVLRRRMPKTRDGFFFPAWQGRFAVNRDSGNAWFLKIVRRAAKRAGLRWGLRDHGVVWHTMTRASGATRMLREFGVDIRTVQLIGGWSSLDQMAQYLGIESAAEPASASRTRPKALKAVR